MESNQSSNNTKSAQRGYALFELIFTALILLAVSTSCVLEQLGHSPDTLPIFKAFGSLPLNSAETLNFIVDSKKLSIGIVLLFSITCILNICLKFAELTSRPTKTNWLSWIVTLLGGAFFWYFVYFAIRVGNEAQHDYSLFASKNVLDFGTGLVLLAIADFVLFLGMAFKGPDETTPKANMESVSNVDENKDVIDESISIQSDAESISGMTPVLEEPIVEPLQEPKAEKIIEIEEENKSPWLEKNKKWLFPVGGVVVLALLIWGAVSIFGSSKGNDLLPVQKLAWDKFVVVLNDKVAVFKESKTISPQLQIMQENLDSDAAARYFKWSDADDKRGYSSSNYLLSKNRILPVIGEEDEWYKVSLSEEHVGTVDCYIQKTYCREVKPEPITPEVLNGMKSYNWYTAFYGLQTDGKYKNICFVSVMGEMEGEWLDVAVLYDGVLINPLTKHISTQLNHDENTDPLVVSSDNGYTCLYYSDSMTDNYVFDARKISQEAKNGKIDLNHLFESIPTSQSSTQEVSYYFPEIDKDHLVTFIQDVSGSHSSANIDAVEDKKEFTGYTFFADKLDDMVGLYAEADGDRRCTDITGERIDVLDQDDYDGDGEPEALVYVWGGGNSVEPPFIVYFDKETQEFKKALGFEDASDQPLIKVEKWKGKTSFRVDIGLRKDRYVYENHEVKLAERIAPNVGKVLSTITVSQLFGSSEEMEEKTANIDIDGNGEKDNVIFMHDTSHLLMWGKQMMLKDMSSSYWCLPDGLNEIGVVGEKFAFIKPDEGDIPSLLVDDAWFYKWTAEGYVRQ